MIHAGHFANATHARMIAVVHRPAMRSHAHVGHCQGDRFPERRRGRDMARVRGQAGNPHARPVHRLCHDGVASVSGFDDDVVGFGDADLEFVDIDRIDLLAIGECVAEAQTIFDRYWNSQPALPIRTLHKLRRIRRPKTGLRLGVYGYGQQQAEEQAAHGAERRPC